MQVTQNKRIQFYVKHNSKHHVGAKEFKEINWLPTEERVEQRIATKVVKYMKGTSLFYLHELFFLQKYIQN